MEHHWYRNESLGTDKLEPKLKVQDTEYLKWQSPVRREMLKKLMDQSSIILRSDLPQLTASMQATEGRSMIALDSAIKSPAHAPDMDLRSLNELARDEVGSTGVDVKQVTSSKARMWLRHARHSDVVSQPVRPVQVAFEGRISPAARRRLRAHIENVTSAEPSELPVIEAALRKALTAEPDNTTYLEKLGIVLHRLGQEQEAEEYYQRTASLNPNRHSVYGNLGLLYERRKDFVRAEEYFRHALRLEPSSEKARMGLARTLSRQGHMEDARREIKPLLTSTNSQTAEQAAKLMDSLSD